MQKGERDEHARTLLQEHLAQSKMRQKFLLQHERGWWAWACRAGTTAFLLQRNHQPEGLKAGSRYNV